MGRPAGVLFLVELLSVSILADSSLCQDFLWCSHRTYDNKKPEFGFMLRSLQAFKLANVLSKIAPWVSTQRGCWTEDNFQEVDQTDSYFG